MHINRNINPINQYGLDLNDPDAILLHCDSENKTFTNNLYNYIIMRCLNRPELNTGDLTGGGYAKVFTQPNNFVLELLGLSLHVTKISTAAQTTAQMGVGHLADTFTETTVNQADTFNTIFGVNFRCLRMRTNVFAPLFNQIGLNNFPHQLVQEHDTNYINGGRILCSNLIIPSGSHVFTCLKPDEANALTAQFQVYAYGRLRRAAV